MRTRFREPGPSPKRVKLQGNEKTVPPVEIRLGAEMGQSPIAECAAFTLEDSRDSSVQDLVIRDERRQLKLQGEAQGIWLPLDFEGE